MLIGFLTFITLNLKLVFAASADPEKNKPTLILPVEVKEQEVVEVRGVIPMQYGVKGRPKSAGNPIIITSVLTKGTGDITVKV